ncbi:E3 ubiquitin-protein ligase AIRP2 isoform X2 [Rhododendron vialii]|uniref:E3 ubiquitin-protein ligase AIRP2 isoform X2 n=1 Tax=Rhododendron vialii TaxID=182163 RepID=UPI00266031DE|nr:E3 ubiquitin-protein ligase AIRP2 isoform X2 [Rhododendron vialii]
MAMKKSFKDSLKALEADIQHANTLALGCPRLNDGACLQLRLSYSPVAHLFLFLVQWADCQLAGTLGLLRVLIYMTYADGKTTMSVYERKASIREFYAVIFPSLLLLQSGITDLDDRKQKEICSLRFSKKDDLDKGKLTEADIEREDECGICMEMNSKVVLPNCSHTLCMKCYQDWRGRSQSCPFCRDSLKRVNSGDLWICIGNNDISDISIILRENLQRLFMYIEKLPLIVPDHVFVSYDSRFK